MARGGHVEGRMDVRHVVAAGTDEAGVSWVIWARRDEPRDGDLLSMIRLTDPGGRILHLGASSGVGEPDHAQQVTVARFITPSPDHPRNPGFVGTRGDHVPYIHAALHMPPASHPLSGRVYRQ